MYSVIVFKAQTLATVKATSAGNIFTSDCSFSTCMSFKTIKVIGIIIIVVVLLNLEPFSTCMSFKTIKVIGIIIIVVVLLNLEPNLKFSLISLKYMVSNIQKLPLLRYSNFHIQIKQYTLLNFELD